MKITSKKAKLVLIGYKEKQMIFEFEGFLINLDPKKREIKFEGKYDSFEAEETD